MTHAVAVIGTREPTPLGSTVARRVARHFAERGYRIVSGLAKGLDTAGHQGALKAEGGHTVAVMGTPLDTIYPKENTRLAKEICARGGALVSEYALDTRIARGAFAQRDRIQAGMALAVIVVQTALDGGSMHAVRAAHKYKRLVLCPEPLAGPGETDEPQYKGIRYILDHPTQYGDARSFRAETYHEIEATLEAAHLRFMRHAPDADALPLPAALLAASTDPAAQVNPPAPTSQTRKKPMRAARRGKHASGTT